MTAAARVVVVDGGQLIEPQQIAEPHQPAVDASAEPVLEGALDGSRETLLTQDCGQLAIELAVVSRLCNDCFRSGVDDLAGNRVSLRHVETLRDQGRSVGWTREHERQDGR